MYWLKIARAAVIHPLIYPDFIDEYESRMSLARVPRGDAVLGDYLHLDVAGANGSKVERVQVDLIRIGFGL